MSHSDPSFPPSPALSPAAGPDSDGPTTSPGAARGRVRLRLLYDQGSIGPGKINLLEAIARTGSISAAARSLDMTFRRGWQLIETMNRLFSLPVVRTTTGGKAGGGAALTPFGQALVERYRSLEATAQTAAAPHLEWLEAFVSSDAGLAPQTATGDDHDDGGDDAGNDD